MWSNYAFRLTSFFAENESDWKKWSVVDYRDWFFFFDTKQGRIIRRSRWKSRIEKYKDEKAKMHLEKVILYEDISKEYIYSFVLKWIFMGVAFVKIVNHLNGRGSSWNPPPFSFFSYPSFQNSIDYFLIGCLMLMMVDRLVSLNDGFSIACKAPLYKAMRHPYFSTSVCDFWANRWNGFTQESLRRGVFDPIMKMMNSISPTSSHFKMIVIIATFATFVASGYLVMKLLILA